MGDLIFKAGGRMEVPSCASAASPDRATAEPSIDPPKSEVKDSTTEFEIRRQDVQSPLAW